MMPTENTKILIVDDDAQICDLLGRYLSAEGFRVSTADNGEAMRRQMADTAFDLVILDLVMPGGDGLSLAREVRATSDVPIIMVTGKGEPIDRVVGLEVGADDYIAKPFHLREVLARVRAVLRRRAPSPNQSVHHADVSERAECVMFAGWRLDLIKRELRAPAGSSTELTTSEFNLLAAFVSNARRVLTRDQLMDATRGLEWTPFDRSIDTQIGRLRKKIETNPSRPALIKTVRGVGYVFAANVELQ